VRGKGGYDPRTGFGRDYRRFYDLDLGQRVFNVAHREHQLAVQVFKPSNPRGTALVLHGYYDHVGLYGHLIRYLLGKSLAVLAYDQQGHGLSTGAAATISSFDDYVEALVTVLESADSKLPEPWHAFGQSMGGSVLMEYTELPGARCFEHAVLLAPLIRPKYWAVNKLMYRLIKPFGKSVLRGSSKNSQNREFNALLKNDPLQARALPVQWVTAMANWMERFERSEHINIKPLVVQGGRDQTVDGVYNLSVLRRFYDMELLEIPEARHHLVNETAAIREQVWQFLDRHLEG
jgi:alpha-beta hydrolase superfamily lysophospholipase